jgi:putative sporulation protein YyaC
MKLNPFRAPLVQTEASFHYEEPFCSIKLQTHFCRLLSALDPAGDRALVILCIGTDRSTGDSLGPLVGTTLRGLGLPPSCVQGTLDEPVHATNLAQVLTDLHELYRDPLIIPIDASLGDANRVGFINLRKGSLSPGTAVKKELPPVGEFHISANVNVSGFLEHLVLQNTRLSVVVNMANTIARSVYFGLQGRTNPNLQS